MPVDRRTHHGLDVVAHHHARQRSRRLLSRVAVTDHLAVAQHGGRVAHALHLFEAMRDVEDRLALGAQPLQRLEQLVGFLRRQHRGRLVEDDQLRRLQQAADDLDALALADRQVADQRIGIERQAIAVGQRLGLGGDGGDRRLVVERQRDVFGRGQRVEQRKMLEHHADAELARGARAGNADRLAIPADFAGIGFERAEQHLDQRRLAGSVLAQKRMDLARARPSGRSTIARLQRCRISWSGREPQAEVAPLSSRVVCTAPPSFFFFVPAGHRRRARDGTQSTCSIESASRISWDQDGRSCRPARLEIGMGTGRFGQRVALVDRDLDDAAARSARTARQPPLPGRRAWRCR